MTVVTSRRQCEGSGAGGAGRAARLRSGAQRQAGRQLHQRGRVRARRGAARARQRLRQRRLRQSGERRGAGVCAASLAGLAGCAASLAVLQGRQ